MISATIGGMRWSLSTTTRLMRHPSWRPVPRSRRQAARGRWRRRGYHNFLTIMADRQDPEHADMKRWCGGHFDPEWFDLELTDKDVRNALRPNARRRLNQPKPKRAKAGGSWEIPSGHHCTASCSQ
jgi:hypothetical protein